MQSAQNEFMDASVAELVIADEVMDGDKGPTDSFAGADEHSRAAAAAVSAMFGRDGLFMAASALQLLSGLFLTPILTRVLEPHEFGQFAADIALFYVLLLLSSLGLNTGIQRLHARPIHRTSSRELLAAAVVLILVVSLVFFVTGPFWSPVLGFGTFGTPEKLTVAWAGLAAITLVSLALLRSHNRLPMYAVISFLQSVGGLGVGIVIALALSRTVADVLLGAVSVQLVAALLALTAIPPKWRGVLNWRLTQGVLGFSLPLVPQLAGSFVIAAADRFVIQRDLGSGQTGRYQVAYSVGALAINVLAFLNQAWLPRIFTISDPVRRSMILQKSRDALLVVLMPVTIGLALGGPVVLQVWAPASFRTSGLTMVLILVIASSIPLCLCLSSVRGLLAEGKSGVVAFATLIAAAINIVLNLILVPTLNIDGSALATLVSYIALAVFMASFRHLQAKVPGIRWVVWVELAAANAVLFASWYVPLGGGWTGLRLAGSAVCLAWGVWAVRRLAASSPNTERSEAGRVAELFTESPSTTAGSEAI
jgi:O-antigen/teichoic acid export membrane protein